MQLTSGYPVTPRWPPPGRGSSSDLPEFTMKSHDELAVRGGTPGFLVH